jgi:hypothetical protein
MTNMTTFGLKENLVIFFSSLAQNPAPAGFFMEGSPTCAAAAPYCADGSPVTHAILSRP